MDLTMNVLTRLQKQEVWRLLVGSMGNIFTLALRAFIGDLPVDTLHRLKSHMSSFILWGPKTLHFLTIVFKLNLSLHYCQTPQFQFSDSLLRILHLDCHQTSLLRLSQNPLGPTISMLTFTQKTRRNWIRLEIFRESPLLKP